MGKRSQSVVEELARQIVARRPRLNSIAQFLDDLREWVDLGVRFRYGLQHIRSFRDFGDGLLIATHPIRSREGVLAERSPVCEVYHQRMLAQNAQGLIPIILDPRVCGVALGLSKVKADALTSADSQSFRGYNRQLRQELVDICQLPRRKAFYVHDGDYERFVQQAGCVPAVLQEAEVVGTDRQKDR